MVPGDLIERASGGGVLFPSAEHIVPQMANGCWDVCRFALLIGLVTVHKFNGHTSDLGFIITLNDPVRVGWTWLNGWRLRCNLALDGGRMRP